MSAASDRNMQRERDWFVGVLDAMSDMVLVKGARSRLLWANKAFLKYYGMTNDQLKDLIDAPHSDPDDTVQYVKDDHHVFTTGETLSIESEPVTDAVGEISYYHTVKSPLVDGMGQVVGTVGVSRPVADARLVDLSAQVRSQKKDSSSELRILVRHIPLPVAMFDVHHRMLCCSDAWTSLFGEVHQRDEVFYDACFEPRLPISQPMTEVVTSGGASQIEGMGIQRPGETPIVADVSINPWSLSTGGVGGTIVLIQDVTEVRQSERGLQTLNEELMQFNYRVSHDLVGPLRTIKGYLEMCDEQADRDPELVKSINRKMARKVDQLAQLVRDVLDLARADLRDEKQEEIDPEALVREVVESHQEELEPGVGTLRVSIDASPFVSSRFRLRQILENLVSNALKYRDPNKTRHEVHIQISASEQQLRLMVVDNGTGIDPAVRDHIFDIFVRGSSTHPGSGLGLYLVQKHVGKLGGEVSVRSDDTSTTFEVRLPLLQGAP